MEVNEENITELSAADIAKEVEEVNETSEIVSQIVGMKPTLEQYNKDLQTGQNNIINERLGIERVVHWSAEQQEIVEKRHNDVLEKYDQLDKHLNTIIEDAPNKLAVTVTVSQANKDDLQTMYDAQIAKMKEEHEKQMQEIYMEYSNQKTDAYKFGNDQRSEIHRMLKDSDGFYIHGSMYWLCAFFFWVGVVTTVVLVVLAINQATV